MKISLGASFASSTIADIKAAISNLVSNNSSIGAGEWRPFKGRASLAFNVFEDASFLESLLLFPVYLRKGFLEIIGL